MSLEKKKVSQLQEMLKKAGLPSDGKKAELVQRLSQHLEEEKKENSKVVGSPRKSVGNGSPVNAARISIGNGTVSPVPAGRPSALMTDAEKILERAKRFGVDNPVLEAEKLKERAKKFGTHNPEVEKEKLMERAKRFGTDNADLESEKKRQRSERFGIVDDAEKKKRRMERFGGNAASGGKLDMALEPKKELNEDDKKKMARMERFGSSVMTDEDKKKLRASRFG